VWISNARNNFAPFAGFMLAGYERTSPGDNGAERDGEDDDVHTAGETIESKADDAPM
jgi:hypothetical protein